MFDFFKLKSPIGRSYNTDPDDVRKTKKVLNTFGYYDEPAHGITEYPDGAMISGIESFQKDNGLKKDGVMKPGGETERTIGSLISSQLHKTERSKADLTQPVAFSSVSSLTPKKPKEPMPIQMGYKLGEALKLSAPVGLNQKNEPSDVNRIKKAMSWTGLYPSHEAEQQDGQMNQNLMRSIGMFQSANGLKQDFWMKPDGETAKHLDTNLQNKFAALVKMADASGGDGGGGDDGGDKPSDPPSEGGSPPDDGGEKPEDPPDDEEEPDAPDEEDPCADLEGEVEDLKDQLQSKEEEQNNLDIEIDDLEYRIGQLKQEISWGPRSNDGGKEDISPADFVSLSPIGTFLKGVFTPTDTQGNHDEKIRIDNLKIELSQKEEELEQAKERLKNMDEEIKNLESDLDEAEKSLHECEASRKK